jgi:hypothetical protein
VGTGIGRAKADALAAKIASVPAKESLQIHYIANDQLPNVLPYLRAGDIALVVRTFPVTKTRPEHLSCDHMGVIALNGGEVDLVHSSRPKAREMGLMVFVRAYPFVRGFVFLRLRDDARQMAPIEAAKVEPESNKPDPARADARNARASSGTPPN